MVMKAMVSAVTLKATRRSSEVIVVSAAGQPDMVMVVPPRLRPNGNNRRGSSGRLDPNQFGHQRLATRLILDVRPSKRATTEIPLGPISECLNHGASITYREVSGVALC